MFGSWPRALSKLFFVALSYFVSLKFKTTDPVAFGTAAIIFSLTNADTYVNLFQSKDLSKVHSSSSIVLSVIAIVCVIASFCIVQNNFGKNTNTVVEVLLYVLALFFIVPFCDLIGYAFIKIKNSKNKTFYFTGSDGYNATKKKLEADIND